MKISRVVAACTLVSVALMVHAKSEQKPGLWENTVKVTMGGAFPQLDAVMIEQLEASGVQLPFLKPMTTQTCLTPEQVRQETLPDFNDPDSGCATRNVRREGDQVLGNIACNGQIQGTGSLRLDLHGPESYSGVQHFEGLAQGLPVTMKTDIRGRWMQADCGSVRPLGQ